MNALLLGPAHPWQVTGERPKQCPNSVTPAPSKLGIAIDQQARPSGWTRVILLTLRHHDPIARRHVLLGGIITGIRVITARGSLQSGRVWPGGATLKCSRFN